MGFFASDHKHFKHSYLHRARREHRSSEHSGGNTKHDYRSTNDETIDMYIRN